MNTYLCRQVASNAAAINPYTHSLLLAFSAHLSPCIFNIYHSPKSWSLAYKHAFVSKSYLKTLASLEARTQLLTQFHDTPWASA